MVYQRMKKNFKFIAICLLVLYPQPLLADGTYSHLAAEHLSLLWGVPFIGILLSIALIPLFFPKIWHHHFGKISALWCLGFLIPCWTVYGPDITTHNVLHTILLEYIPFIILLFSLFTTTGGLQVIGGFRGTPFGNTVILTAGSLIASLIGTTGASMLLIHPLIKANSKRQHKTHIIIFFIFLVSNIGGILTPLGDPPLFLGFLKDVPFFWPAQHLLIPLLIVGIPLISFFYVLDSWFFKKERFHPHTHFSVQKLQIKGAINLVFLAGILGGVLLSGIWRSGIVFDVFGVSLKLENCLRDVALLVFSALSLRLSPKEARYANHFNWAPMVEVSKIFAAIFITVDPVLAMLGAGANGPFASLFELVLQNGAPNDVMYFWLTGILSSFLDNAPTYLVFFHMAGGNAEILACACYKTLIAISSGAVFMGAMTYIGNAPNFMVRSVAEQEGIKMPSFFGYMAWSIPILGVLFLILTFTYFV